MYVSEILESYKYTMIGHLVKSGTSEFLLHIVQCWSAGEVDEVDEVNHAIPMVPYFSVILYKYYSCLGCIPIKDNEEVKDINR